MSGKPVYQQIADELDEHGRGTVEIKRDDGAGHEDGSPCEGPGYIRTGLVSFCYYRTRRDAQRVVSDARQTARERAGS